MAYGLKTVNGDFVISGSKTVEMVEGSDKCVRDFGKMLRTDAESQTNITPYYRYNPTYGSLLGQLMAVSGVSRQNLLQLANDLVYATIKNYLSLQESRGNLSLGEIIVNSKYETYYDPSNPAVILIPIKITTGESLTFDLGTFEEKIS